LLDAVLGTSALFIGAEDAEQSEQFSVGDLGNQAAEKELGQDDVVAGSGDFALKQQVQVRVNHLVLHKQAVAHVKVVFFLVNTS